MADPSSELREAKSLKSDKKKISGIQNQISVPETPRVGSKDGITIRGQHFASIRGACGTEPAINGNAAPTAK